MEKRNFLKTIGAGIFGFLVVPTPAISLKPLAKPITYISPKLLIRDIDFEDALAAMTRRLETDIRDKVINEYEIDANYRDREINIKVKPVTQVDKIDVNFVITKEDVA